MTYDYEIREEAMYELSIDDYMTLEKFLMKFIESTDPETEDFVDFCRREGYDYYVTSAWRNIPLVQENGTTNTRDAVRVFYIFPGIGLEREEANDYYLAVICPLKLLSKKIKRVVGLTVYPKASVHGKIAVPEGIKDVRGYIREHFDKVLFERPKLDYRNADFVIHDDPGPEMEKG